MKSITSYGAIAASLVLVVLILFLGCSLNPFTNDLFPFHDVSQAARISEFTYNLQTLHIPPRIAPHFEEGRSYAAFNFYAPFAYWVTSVIHLLGFSIQSAIKLSFLTALVVGFFGMVLLSRKFFSSISSLGTGVLYVTGLYFAVNIFVRGNLAETWYMGLLPLALFFVLHNGVKASKLSFVLATVVFSFVLTVHTIFSPLSLFLFCILLLLQPKKGANSLSLLLGLGLASYFFIPALIELPLTYAREVATLTKYSDHFVCIQQLWSSPWGFAGSAPGCETDGLSFMLGKLQILLGITGVLIFLVLFFKSKKRKSFLIPLFFLGVGFFSLFLTLYESTFIWNAFSPLLSIFQFPWRFLTLVTLCLAFFSGYSFDFIQKMIPSKFAAYFIIVSIACFAVISHAKYFTGQSIISGKEYESKYLSQTFIGKEAAKYLPEYFPKVGSFQYWKSRVTEQVTEHMSENSSFYKSFQVTKPGQVVIPVTYLPYWTVTVNGVRNQPARFDAIAQPVFDIKQPATIEIMYRQTTTERMGNLLSIASLVGLIGIVLYTKAWQNIQRV